MNPMQTRETETRNDNAIKNVEPTAPRPSSLKIKTTVKAGMADGCSVW